MRSIWLIILALVSALFIANTSWSQEGSRIPISGRAIEFEATNELPQSPAEDTALRQQYLELVRTKAELMTDATLKAEIAETQRNINELKALQKLKEAQQLLLSIRNEFPDSDAALSATRMLNAIEISDSQAAYPDDVGPALNTAAGEPFRRSSLSREVIPELPPAGATPPFPEPSTDVAPKSVVPEKSTNAAPRVNFPVLPGNRSPR